MMQRGNGRQSCNHHVVHRLPVEPIDRFVHQTASITTVGTKRLFLATISPNQSWGAQNGRFWSPDAGPRGPLVKALMTECDLDQLTSLVMKGWSGGRTKNPDSDPSTSDVDLSL